MAAAKKLTAAILARRASKGSRGKRTRPGPRQYTVAELERARDRVAAAARRLDVRPIYGIGSSSRTVTAGCESILDRNWGTKNSDLIGRKAGIPFRRVAIL